MNSKRSILFKRLFVNFIKKFACLLYSLYIIRYRVLIGTSQGETFRFRTQTLTAKCDKVRQETWEIVLTLPSNLEVLIRASV